MMISQKTRFARTALAAIVMAALLTACASQQRQSATGLAFNGKPGSPEEFSQVVGDRVFFTTDSAVLSETAKTTLRRQAKWLRRYSQYTASIQGHADERGTREYNIALGGRRAAAARAFLVSQGINPRRLTTTSFGKERPVAVCNDISCWSQNRRAVLVLNPSIGS